MLLPSSNIGISNLLGMPRIRHIYSPMQKIALSFIQNARSVKSSHLDDSIEDSDASHLLYPTTFAIIHQRQFEKRTFNDTYSLSGNTASDSYLISYGSAKYIVLI